MTATRVNLEHFENCIGATLRPAIDPAAEALELALQQKAEAEAQENARMTKIEALTEAIQNLPLDSAETRQNAIRAILKSIEMSISALLPEIARLGFAGEASLAIREIIERAQLANPELLLSPADYETVVGLSTSFPPTSPLKISEDSSVPANSARLRWDNGGAEISANEVSERASSLLSRQLESISKREPVDV